MNLFRGKEVKVFVVGGFVRDKLLGLKPKDVDFVVVGISPEEMIEKGFKEVGKNFPVFLHPVTGDEYALARTERKVGIGYKGFECDWRGVTLEQDLERRDLTINAMAQEVEVHPDGSFNVVGELIDPFDGLLDLTNKYLRETSEAFSEDPMRVLRVARFLARYEDFKIAPSLKIMCDKVYYSGELGSLVPDRIWMETEKALKEKFPSRYFEFISKYVFPFTEIFIDMKNTTENNPYHQESDVLCHTMMVLNHASENWNDPEINFACVLHDIAKPFCYKAYGNGHGHDAEGVSMIKVWCEKWKVPNNYCDLATLVCKQHQRIHSVFGRNGHKMSKAKSIMKIFEESRAIQNPERFLKVLKACESDSKGRIGLTAKDDYLQRSYLEECLDAVINLDTKAISSKLLENGKSGEIIGLEIRAARIGEIRKVQNKWKEKLNAKLERFCK